MGNLNVMISLLCALLGVVIGAIVLRVLQRPGAAALDKASAESRGLLEQKEREAAEVLERARRDSAELLQKAEEARRVADDERRKAEDSRRDAETAKKEAALEARAAALNAVELAKDEAAKAVADAEKLSAAREDRAARREQLAREKEQELAETEVDLAKRDATLKIKESNIEELRSEAASLVSQQRAKLEAIAGVSGEQVRRELIEEFFDEARRAAARESKAIEDAAREEAEKRAKRIIGREGRNIRALQEACGVDFIVDDTPETIVISGFDPLRREIAKVAVEKLIEDGRIHPTRIEEVVQKAQAEIERTVGDAGEQALVELGLTRVHPELSRLLGRLKYRYSYAQNVLRHSIECGYLCGLMAVELGQDEKIAKRAGLLHDIGKAVSHEQEGGHAVIGGQYARKFGEEPIVANGIACHHNDEPPTSIIGNLVTAADALSGARPGARREMLEGYVKRLADLEAISKRFAGVERTFAIQAGREVRVMVEPSEVSDAEAALLAREISKKIEEELTYPGQIRVTVVRETRAIDYAK